MPAEGFDKNQWLQLLLEEGDKVCKAISPTSWSYDPLMLRVQQRLPALKKQERKNFPRKCNKVRGTETFDGNLGQILRFCIICSSQILGEP